MGNTIYGSFEDPSLAERAAGALLDYGVRPEDISLVRNHHGEGFATQREAKTGPIAADEASEQHLAYTGSVYGSGTLGVPTATSAADMQSFNTAYGDIAASKAGELNLMYGSGTLQDPRDIEDEYERDAKEGITVTTPADAGIGAVKGLAWGAGVGVLAGIASLIIPGVGLVLGSGALATALAGVAGTAGAGALAGAVTGYLKDQGMDEHVAASYQNTVDSGGAILAVMTPSPNVDEATVRQVMEKYGAEATNICATRTYLA